ncbi:MAG TPA: heat-inducible transcriptional repressor HrcA [Acidiferrobacteraceae bacterium]|nr:heat-inducible transcriptional repressor HrcA [Acidiferrobacteraceae bacterium]
MILSGRAEILLKTLIERYIADGQPVGSRTLAKQAGLDLSPATVRNVMADLEDMGLVRSPHTSAGRVPTQLGYRLFVDSLLTVRPPEDGEWQRLAQDLSLDQQPERLLESASLLLSQVTRMTGMVRVPRREQAAFRHIEFLSLSPKRLLAILVTQDGRVHNRIVQPDREYSPAELTQAGNYFNETYAGMQLNEVKVALRDSLKRDGEDMQRVVRAAMAVATEVVGGEEPDDVVVSGESNLFSMPDLNTARLRQLLETFNTKSDLLQLLDQSMRAGGVHIFIGSESGYEALEACSVVAAPYQVDGRIVGTLGVIGPTRMPYQQVISIVDMTARLLSGALSHESRALSSSAS